MTRATTKVLMGSTSTTVLTILFQSFGTSSTSVLPTTTNALWEPIKDEIFGMAKKCPNLQKENDTLEAKNLSIWSTNIERDVSPGTLEIKAQFGTTDKERLRKKCKSFEIFP